MSIRSLERDRSSCKMADPHLYQSFRICRERQERGRASVSLEKMKRRAWSLRENVKSQKTECKEKMKEMFKYERRFMYEMEVRMRCEIADEDCMRARTKRF